MTEESLAVCQWPEVRAQEVKALHQWLAPRWTVETLGKIDFKTSSFNVSRGLNQEKTPLSISLVAAALVGQQWMIYHSFSQLSALKVALIFTTIPVAKMAISVLPALKGTLSVNRQWKSEKKGMLPRFSALTHRAAIRWAAVGLPNIYELPVTAWALPLWSSRMLETSFRKLKLVSAEKKMGTLVTKMANSSANWTAKVTNFKQWKAGLTFKAVALDQESYWMQTELYDELALAMISIRQKRLHQVMKGKPWQAKDVDLEEVRELLSFHKKKKKYLSQKAREPLDDFALKLDQSKVSPSFVPAPGMPSILDLLKKVLKEEPVPSDHLLKTVLGRWESLHERNQLIGCVAPLVSLKEEGELLLPLVQKHRL